jgi:hypothetical protein
VRDRVVVHGAYAVLVATGHGTRPVAPVPALGATLAVMMPAAMMPMSII